MIKIVERGNIIIKQVIHNNIFDVNIEVNFFNFLHLFLMPLMMMMQLKGIASRNTEGYFSFPRATFYLFIQKSHKSTNVFSGF